MSGRHVLPLRRRSETFMLKHGDLNTEFAVTFGFFSEGSIGEVFISGAKVGSDVDASVRDNAVLLSLALQYGVPIETVLSSLTREADGSMSTVVGKVAEMLVERQREEHGQ